MVKTLLFAASLVLATTIANPAEAGPIEKLQGELNAYAKESVELFDKAYQNAFSIDSNGKLAKARDTAGCFDAIATAKAAGVKADDHLSDYWILQIHPKKQDKGGEKFIVFSDASWICENHAAKVKLKRAALIAKDAAARTANAATQKPETDNADVPSMVANAQRCHTWIDELAQDIGGETVDVDGSKVKVSEIGARYCAPLVEAMEAYGAKVLEARAAKRGAISAKYEAVGMKGDRLELFIEYDNVYWRAKKCEIVDDVQKLAKAKYLYQWLQNADGTHTIRKYTFKGNKYKVSEKTYLTEAKAYKGCK